MMLTSDEGSAHAKTEMARMDARDGFRDVEISEAADAEPAHAGPGHQAVNAVPALAGSAASAGRPTSGRLADCRDRRPGADHPGARRRRDQPQGALPDRPGRIHQHLRSRVHPRRGSVSNARRGCSCRCRWCFPWLLYPVITQGDQIIDNLSINPMRVDLPRPAGGDLRHAGGGDRARRALRAGAEAGRPASRRRLDGALSRPAAARRGPRARRHAPWRPRCWPPRSGWPISISAR